MNPWYKRIVVVASVSSAIVLLSSTVASAEPVSPRPNEGWISMTKRTCGNSATWQEQARRNGVTDSPWLAILGRTYDINCGSTPQRAPEAAPVETGWTHPLPGRCVTSLWSMRVHPISGVRKMHQGIDFPAPAGTDVLAAASGVAYRGNQPGGAGLYVMIDHGNGVWTMYFHLSQQIAQSGQWVNAGQHIGEVGSTGNSTGNHLHFELHLNGQWVKQYDTGLDTNVYAEPIYHMAQRGVTISRC